MGKLFLFTFLGLLMVVNATVENYILDNAATLRELKNLDIEEEDSVELSSRASESPKKVIVNVDASGAVGDGAADDTQAFLTAWKTACSTQNAVFMVTQNRQYLVSATIFKGPCADNLVIQIDGTMVAPNDPSSWNAKDMRNWLTFSNLNGVVIQGTGGLDGKGELWWKSSCKKNESNPIQNSQQMHFVISHSDSVLVSGVEVSAPADSPNTDGIHITGSTNVVLQDTTIGTGDDCISIVNGSSAIKMKKITCGPGHGISIGSLGKDGSTGIVTKVVLDSAVLKKTTNGLRIKTWQGGNGYVEGASFSNVKMQDVANPIIIDQNYCDSPTPCSQKDSAVQISKIMYRNISGTTKSKRAMSFDCSEKFPCTGVVVNNIELESKNGTVEAYCHFATGLSSGVVQPSAACLEQTERRTVHTEL